MPLKRRIAKARAGELTRDEYWNLTLGWPQNAFENERVRRAAWIANREKLMAESTHGHRPVAFWDYDFKGEWPADARDDAEAVYLLGIVSEPERAALEAHWVHCIAAAKERNRSRPENARKDAIEHIGCPAWFWDAHHGGEA